MSNEVTITEADLELLAVEYDRAFARKSASRLRSGQVMPGAIIKEPAALRAIAKARQSSLSTAMVEMREALEEIVNPVAAMQRRAEAEGNRLSGMAYQIANDPAYLQSIARTALSKLSETESE